MKHGPCEETRPARPALAGKRIRMSVVGVGQSAFVKDCCRMLDGDASDAGLVIAPGWTCRTGTARPGHPVKPELLASPLGGSQPVSDLGGAGSALSYLADGPTSTQRELGGWFAMRASIEAPNRCAANAWQDAADQMVRGRCLCRSEANAEPGRHSTVNPSA